jgi:LysM repeat protein
MGRTAGKLTLIMIMVIGSIFVGTIFSYQGAPQDDTSQADFQGATVTPLATPTETIPPNTPLPTLTPSQTLLPPPTFEPPTATPTLTPIPSQAPTATTIVEVSIPGLNGAETPTPSTTPGCVPRKDWKLTYTVQFDDTLSAIAAKYNTWVEDLVDANCIKDKNLIVIGQVLRVPGEVQPASQEVACVPWQVLTPINGAVTVPADGSITFNWIGPAAPINLIRIFRPDGSKYEVVIELRQNESVNLNDNLAEAGTYTWYVYPLGRDFQQIQCLEGGPWTFTKPQSSTPTPTPSASSGSGSGSLGS